MRKITKPEVICEHCGSILKSAEYEEFCDYCKRKIEIGTYFDISTFFKDFDQHSEKDRFCSIKCLKDWISNYPYNIEKVSFISLPYVHDLEVLKELLNL
uniref:Uncharacterized protein n=1 Tax=viral metagenome TaxID=1070528 RepID=A0A6H2A0X5_9ZZZZ